MERPLVSLVVMALLAYVESSLPCNSITSAWNGIIETANYPNNYDDGSTCTWTIYAPDHSQFHFEFDSLFSVESAMFCIRDSLKIEASSEGVKSDILKYCNETTPPVVPPFYADKVIVTFKSDASGNKKGFRAQWKYLERCQPGWVHFENTDSHSCLLYITEKKTFSQARQECKKRNADLVKIDSYEKNELVYSFIDTSDYIYLGLIRQNEKLIWVSDNTEVTFTSWYGEEPDNKNGSEDCVSMDLGTWSDVDCESTYNFVCEISDYREPAVGAFCRTDIASDICAGESYNGTCTDERCDCADDFVPYKAYCKAISDGKEDENILPRNHLIIVVTVASFVAILILLAATVFAVKKCKDAKNKTGDADNAGRGN